MQGTAHRRLTLTLLLQRPSSPTQVWFARAACMGTTPNSAMSRLALRSGAPRWVVHALCVAWGATAPCGARSHQVDHLSVAVKLCGKGHRAGPILAQSLRLSPAPKGCALAVGLLNEGQSVSYTQSTAGTAGTAVSNNTLPCNATGCRRQAVVLQCAEQCCAPVTRGCRHGGQECKVRS